ncbi:class I SAM-dependent methyltransferase [Chryseolinea sp. T2]|uniref:class I SAM-dependent methyltransferase n=1 Tax=Chryseolinea sp. T2 TaxID=3129255 RepID=UPI003076AAAD
MPAQGPNWTQFWKAERHAFDDVMRLATRYFADRFCSAFAVSNKTRVFDYGCGPGFLADELIPKGLIFSGADINSYFIERCSANHPDANFFCVNADAQSNTSILQQHLKGPADFIILLSIAQYLSSPGDLEKIIASLRPHLSAEGQIIIADVVDEHTRSYRDALSLLAHAIKSGKAGAFLRFMNYVLRSEYARIAKNNQLLLIPQTFVEQMAGRLGYTCRQMKGLTFHPTRKNYILQTKD